MTSRYTDPNTIQLDPAAIIAFVRSDNPRKAGTRGHAFFPRYAVGLTIGDLLTAAKRDKVGDAPAHLRWDLSRGAVRVSDPHAADDDQVTAAILGGTDVKRTAPPVADPLGDAAFAAISAEHGVATSRGRGRRAAA